MVRSLATLDVRLRSTFVGGRRVAVLLQPGCSHLVEHGTVFVTLGQPVVHGYQTQLPVLAGRRGVTVIASAERVSDHAPSSTSSAFNPVPPVTALARAAPTRRCLVAAGMMI